MNLQLLQLAEWKQSVVCSKFWTVYLNG